jgi:GxxExxY protein
MLARPSPLVEKVIGCAIEVHHCLGPGLLESSYRNCLVQEFQLAGINFKAEVEAGPAY